MGFSFNDMFDLHYGRSDLEAVLTTMLDNIFHKTYSSETKAGSCQEIMEAFIPDVNSTSDEMSFEDFRKWCAFLPSVRKFLCSLLMPFDSGIS